VEVSPSASRAVWTAELALRVWRIENDDSWLLWVFAHTTGTSVTRMRNALGAVVAVERSDVEVDAVGAANRERGDVGCEWGGRASLQTLYRAPSHRTGFRERCGVEDVGGPWGRRSPTALPHPAAHR